MSRNPRRQVLKNRRTATRLGQLYAEQERLKAEFVQIQSMLLSIEEFITEERLRQTVDSTHRESSTPDQTWHRAFNV